MITVPRLVFNLRIQTIDLRPEFPLLCSKIKNHAGRLPLLALVDLGGMKILSYLIRSTPSTKLRCVDISSYLILSQVPNHDACLRPLPGQL